MERDAPERAEDLATTLRDLRDELADPPRGPLGIPRPPTPGELLRFTEEYTIPALVAALEAQIRALELLAAVIRVAEGREFEERGDAARERAASAGRATLERLDDVLADLESALTGDEGASPEARRILADARELRAEVDERLAERTPENDDGPATGVDVESELRSIKDEVDGGEGPSTSDGKAPSDDGG